MQVRFKKLSPEAVIPSYSKPGDAGMDLTATSHISEINEAGEYLQVFGTSLAVEIPEGFVGLIFPRSSISKTALSLTNSVGVIDSGYRGEIKFKFSVNSSRATKSSTYKVGDRIGQLVIIPYPNIVPVESEELSSTIRGDGGFGSSGS